MTRKKKNLFISRDVKNLLFHFSFNKNVIMQDNPAFITQTPMFIKQTSAFMRLTHKSHTGIISLLIQQINFIKTLYL